MLWIPKTRGPADRSPLDAIPLLFPFSFQGVVEYFHIFLATPTLPHHLYKKKEDSKGNRYESEAGAQTGRRWKRKRSPAIYWQQIFRQQ